MKKLISLLMALLLALTGVVALAETEGETIIGGADEATSIVVTETVENTLITDGLLVTFIGLAGVFLVLILFFLMIKLMGKMLK